MLIISRALIVYRVLNRSICTILNRSIYTILNRSIYTILNRSIYTILNRSIYTILNRSIYLVLKCSVFLVDINTNSAYQHIAKFLGSRTLVSISLIFRGWSLMRDNHFREHDAQKLKRFSPFRQVFHLPSSVLINSMPHIPERQRRILVLLTGKYWRSWLSWIAETEKSC
jgi:hypothetical protein